MKGELRAVTKISDNGNAKQTSIPKNLWSFLGISNHSTVVEWLEGSKKGEIILKIK